MSLDDQTLDNLKERFGIDFSENEWVEQALTMRSYVNEHPELKDHNQPLATLGDAVIRLLVMNDLFQNNVRDKGEMTKKAESFVMGTTLTEAARTLTLEKAVNWGKGDAVKEIWKEGGVLGECLESLFGAAFLKGGLESCYTMYDAVLARLNKSEADAERTDINRA